MELSLKQTDIIVVIYANKLEKNSLFSIYIFLVKHIIFLDLYYGP